MSTFTSNYELKEDLGKGAFSIVKRCVHRESGQQYAAKIINKKRLTARESEKLEKEERICRKLKHPNIVQLHESLADDLHHYLVFDLVTGGELFDEIVAREYYSEKDASNCLQQILDSIDYCHRQCVIHRDLKPENLLLSSKGKDAVVKLADFGLAVELEADSRPTWHGFAGTPGYLSPEVLKREAYSIPVDVWACGVILYILLVGYPPFWDEDQKRLYNQIKMARYEFPSPEWDTVTEEAKSLIRQMLNPHPDKRITAAEALKNPWISQRHRVASTFNRQDTIAGLKKFNARRKLKGAILTTMIATRSKFNLFRNRVSDSDLPTPAETSPPPNPIPEVPAEAEGGAVVPAHSPVAQSQDTLVPTLQGAVEEVMVANRSLLAAIRNRDFQTYKKLCDPALLTFCKEGGTQLLTGLDFDQFTLSNVPMCTAENITLVNPQVQLLGDSAACICYIRINQIINKAGQQSTTECKETRVWEKKGEDWKCVHVHTS